MSVIEKIYRSFFFLVVFTTGGIYFFVHLITFFGCENIQLQDLITSVLWLSLSIIYLVDRKWVLFPKHRDIFIRAMGLALILLAIYNKYGNY